MKKGFFALAGLLVVTALACPSVFGQSPEFSYQGSLTNGGVAANGVHDFQFALFESLAGGDQIGSTVTVPNITVTNGIFSVRLDFGVVFNGGARFLEIRVRPSGTAAFTTLSPRQLVASSPHAIQALHATTADRADTATTAGAAVSANNFNGSLSGDVTGTQGATVVNTVGGQPSASVANAATSVAGATSLNMPSTLVRRDAGGSFSAGVINASQYNIAGNRVLGTNGSNTFAGVSAGSLTSGQSNSFFGHSAGSDTTTGSANSFFGQGAGSSNTGGNSNSFFGVDAGANNTASENSFFGRRAGIQNTTGVNNSFFGYSAGYNNETSGFNSFFGHSAGFANTTGAVNSFFGADAGAANTTGSFNSFFGRSAGAANTTSNDNSYFGFQAGQSNTTGFSNSFFGRSAGQANTTGDLNSLFGVSAGFSNTTGNENSFFGWVAGQQNSTGDNNSFFGRGAGQLNTGGNLNSFFGSRAGDSNTTGDENSFFGRDTGDLNTTGNNNSFYGGNAGSSNTTGSNNTIIGHSANVGSNALTFATAIGAGSTVSLSNTVVLGRVQDTVVVPHLLQIGSLSGAAGIAPLCITAFDFVANCSSSIRYKRNINQFVPGLSLLRQLRPVSFNWKEGGMPDLGLIAEEVAEVEPLLVTHNQNGAIEGVKYDRLGVILINAVNEQQTSIVSQEIRLDEQSRLIELQRLALEEARIQLNRQRVELDALRTLVCSQNPTAEVCHPKEK